MCGTHIYTSLSNQYTREKRQSQKPIVRISLAKTTKVGSSITAVKSVNVPKKMRKRFSVLRKNDKKVKMVAIERKKEDDDAIRKNQIKSTVDPSKSTGIKITSSKRIQSLKCNEM